ncbi:MAG: PH domain-containing protein [Actinomycetes bacterium]
MNGDPATWTRLHPLTPLLRGWKVLAVVFAIVAQNGLRNPEVSDLGIAFSAALPIAAAYGYLSWRFTRYGFTGDDLTLETGVLFRRSRRVSLSRLQAVDVVRPLFARALGLAELRLEVAGGGSTEAPLAYLSMHDAHRLRAQLLARAAGIDAETPEAPERVLVRVPFSAVMWAGVLRVPLLLSMVVLAGMVLVGALEQRIGIVGIAFPLTLGIGGTLAAWVTSNFDFTVAESPDGLRLRHGLLETRAQTVPPGRVQAVRISEPVLWRRRGWVRLQVNVAGYVSGATDSGTTSTLLPVAPAEVALSLVSRVLPGVDVTRVPLAGVPARCRWRAPVTWSRLAAGADEAVFVAKRGRFHRETDVVPHARTQSVRLTQGSWERRLGLATVWVDTCPGPVRVSAAHRDAAEARAIVTVQADRAVQAVALAPPDRWMSAHRQTPGGETESPAAGDAGQDAAGPAEPPAKPPPGPGR